MAAAIASAEAAAPEAELLRASCSRLAKVDAGKEKQLNKMFQINTEKISVKMSKGLL